ncbi:hypothetical protein MYCTH_2312654 [Thermothelomyces thermophilus ATCC 42464]|uniref:Uncharacterized protein n=1 Tax=Thermothelomyces thermophilus (strain ATCC 42464 / BCRC 31852 / DSM 1799) TaxID=573729 RepID=G2QN29_THET4|nr:uncharacterized protein MYCTH_2312654 [Thermothelomyces thermophilus ATCC 42464]AEO61902.1 hypothetical protein MYCTH_2312654 [Thermothelomyces thermophilus ATCC 42464]
MGQAGRYVKQRPAVQVLGTGAEASLLALFPILLAAEKPRAAASAGGGGGGVGAAAREVCGDAKPTKLTSVQWSRPAAAQSLTDASGFLKRSK